jgi:hypothetical protein
MLAKRVSADAGRGQWRFRNYEITPSHMRLVCAAIVSYFRAHRADECTMDREINGQIDDVCSLMV